MPWPRGKGSCRAAVPELEARVVERLARRPVGQDVGQPATRPAPRFLCEAFAVACGEQRGSLTMCRRWRPGVLARSAKGGSAWWRRAPAAGGPQQPQGAEQRRSEALEAPRGAEPEAGQRARSGVHRSREGAEGREETRRRSQLRGHD